MPVTFASGSTMAPDGRILPPGVEPEPPQPETPAPSPEAPASGTEAAPSEPTGEPPAETQQDPAVAPSDDTEGEQDDLPQTRRQRRQFEARLIRENERLRQQQAAQQHQLAYLTQQLQQGARPQQPPQPTTPQFPQGPQPPRQEQFATHEEWMQAQIAYGVQQALAEERRQEMARRQQDQQAQMQQAWDEKTEAGRDKFDDYDEVVNLPRYAPAIQQVVSDALLGSELGPDLLYYLGSHPADVRKLNGMSPYAAARYLGQLEVQLRTPPGNGNGGSKAPPRQAPGSPPPPVAPPGTSTTPSTDVPERWATLQDYEAWRRRSYEQGRTR